MDVWKPSTPREAFEVTTCYGKQGFDNPQSAHRRRREMTKRRSRGTLSVYRCEVCRQWHIGSGKR